MKGRRFIVRIAVRGKDPSTTAREISRQVLYMLARRLPDSFEAYTIKVRRRHYGERF